MKGKVKGGARRLGGGGIEEEERLDPIDGDRRKCEMNE